MSRELILRRLEKLEARRKPTPEVRCFWKQPGESWEEVRARARAWRAEDPARRWPEPLIFGLRDGDEIEPNPARRFHE